MSSYYNTWKIGDLVKPDRKLNPGYNEGPYYTSLDKNTVYQVVKTKLQASNSQQSIQLVPFSKGTSFKPALHTGADRWYQSKNFTKSGHVEVKKPTNTLADAILGADKAKETSPKPVLLKKDEVPVRLVVDLITGSLVYVDALGRSAFGLSVSTYDKTQTQGADAFISDALRKDPHGKFAVYTLEKVGKVSEIKVKWE